MTTQTPLHVDSNPFGNHKDCSPQETVERIKSILYSVGLGDKEPMAEIRFNPAAGCHSLHLTDKTYPLLGANGKGATDDYSTASAYAEFLERLQCFYPLFFGRLGEIQPQEPMHFDEGERTVSDLRRDAPGVMSELLDTDAAHPDNTLVCLPFWDVSREKIIPLPYEFMTHCTLSTGMSSGNTAEESLTQGICEILERYAVRLVTKERMKMPTIPLETAPIVSPGLRDILTALQEEGFEVIAKDCTNGGTIPVLAVIVVDKENDRYGLCFGSDPVFDVAFQRCITELYQGRNELAYCYSMWSQERPLLKDIYNNVHSSLWILLPDAPPCDFSRAFTAPGKSNAEYLSFVRDQVEAIGGRIYIRDFSFLGFPAHYTYIEKLSAPAPLKAAEFDYFYEGFDESLGVLFRLSEASQRDVERLAAACESKFRSEHIFSSRLEGLLERCLFRLPLHTWMEPKLFLAFIYIEAGRLDVALNMLEEPTAHPLKGDAAELSQLLSAYCRYASQGEQNILERLEEEFGDGPYGASLTHLVNMDWGSLYAKAPADAPGGKFETLPVPRCDSPFSCAGCAYKRKCCLDRFFEIRGKIRKAYRPVDQTLLGRHFSNGHGEKAV
ncbi:YcaO-like family protein [Desulfovibrio inopinatus]|uniref:YcaO-like family protein n=1 Tax=Desulfovibrio inopinatus TaxID=102109 RepID=UPI0004061672|nr:YcaO-like family protein [Desulfovibrio inopinatus]